MDEFKIDRRPFVGERNSADFWIQPTSRLNDSNSVFRQLNFIHGTYELTDEGNLKFVATVELERDHRNWSLIFLGIAVGISIYAELPIVPIFAVGYLLLLIWRVREDKDFYKELLKNELETDGL